MNYHLLHIIALTNGSKYEARTCVLRTFSLRTHKVLLPSLSRKEKKKKISCVALRCLRFSFSTSNETIETSASSRKVVLR